MYKMQGPMDSSAGVKEMKYVQTGTEQAVSFIVQNTITGYGFKLFLQVAALLSRLIRRDFF
jgi:hypothetical protein